MLYFSEFKREALEFDRFCACALRNASDEFTVVEKFTIIKTQVIVLI